MNWKIILPDTIVENRYVAAGAVFGDLISYAYMGRSPNEERLLERWARWEREYSRRGYRTVSLDDFISHGGYGRSIDDLLGVEREEGEDPVLHADIYREHHLGKDHSSGIVEKVWETEEPQVGTWRPPSTKDPQ